MAASYAHIGCCIDRSPCGAAALDSAVALWRASGGRLSLVHVGPYPLALEQIDGTTVFHRDGLNASAREWLSRRTRQIPGADPVFLQGLRGPATCAWAESAGVDLIVVGAGSGRTPGLVRVRPPPPRARAMQCAGRAIRTTPTARVRERHRTGWRDRGLRETLNPEAAGDERRVVLVS